MDRTIQKYLEDILLAIDEIQSFLSQRPRRYQVFLDDHMFRSAIERQVGIIGEAVSKILQINPEIHISNAKQIRTTRNYIVHAYDSVQPHMIWSIIVKDIHLLKQEVESLLDEQLLND